MASNDIAQVCDRLPGKELCSLHNRDKITSLCITCRILVCLSCVMSPEHAGHTFNDISLCLREPTNNLAKRIKEIEKKDLIDVEKELSEMKNQRAQDVKKHKEMTEQINQQRQYSRLKIDEKADSMVIKSDGHSKQVLDDLDEYTLKLESRRNKLQEERKQCSEILQKGSNILKFDAGMQIKKEETYQRPKTSELEYCKYDENVDELLFTAMGILKDPSEIVKIHQYASNGSISATMNYSPSFVAFAPIENDVAWASIDTYYGFKSYKESNKIYRINPSLKVMQMLELDTKTFMLQIHPITKQLFCIHNKCVRRIDTNTGQTTPIVTCPIDIHRIKVTHDNHVIVGARNIKKRISKYKLTGELVDTSIWKYKVYDIDHCSETNNVVLAGKRVGLTLLNNDLKFVTSRTDIACECAIFGKYGNLIVGDYNGNKLVVLNGKDLSSIQTLKLITYKPLELKMHGDILWASSSVQLIRARIT